eukprot:5453956-Pyramimonas_sp.AAC.1
MHLRALDLVEGGHTEHGHQDGAKNDATGDEGVDQVLDGISAVVREGGSGGGGNREGGSGGSGVHLLRLLLAVRKSRQRKLSGDGETIRKLEANRKTYGFNGSGGSIFPTLEKQDP